MAIDVPMPKLGLTMEEATIIEWLVDDGAVVQADQPIMLIETDKTETEVGAPGAGRLHQIGRPGDVFPCGALVGRLLADGELPAEAAAPAVVVPASPLPAPSSASTVPGVASPGEGPERVGRLFASPNARRVAAERGVSMAGVRGTGPGGRIVSEDVEQAARPAPAGPLPGAPVPAATAAAAPVPGAGVGIATLAARNLADLLGIDLSVVAVDPIERRVTREAVARHVRDRLAGRPPGSVLPESAGPESAGRESAARLAPLLQEPTQTIRFTGMRGTIARRMRASLREMAQLTLTMDAEMTALLADRAERRERGAAPSITDYVVAATARALLRHPYANAQVTDSGIALLPGVHVGLAVAVDGGLFVPVVRDAAHLDLMALAAETARLAGAARSGALTPGDLEGGTFSVSALGAQGVDAFTPVINPPNAGILGVGRIRDDVVLADGAVTTVKRATLSLTWDHRVFDGVPAAEFCATIVELLARPALLD